MASWINILCAFVLCSVNQTFSQLISQCEELNQCNNKLFEVLSSENLIVCRVLLEYIPCMQEVKKNCRNESESVNEYLAFAAKTYNNSNCSGVVSSKMTTVDPTGVGPISSATRGTPLKSRRPSRRTVRTPSMTSLNSVKTSSTIWPSRRSSSGLVKITVAERTGRPTEPSASFSYPDDMEPPTAGVSSRQCVYLPTIALVTISHVIVA